MQRAAILLFGLASCATLIAVPPFEDASDVRRLENDERRVWARCDEAIDGIANSGQVHEDDACREYLQSILDRLYPEYRGAMHVEILSAPVLNAFCMANGAIYVHTGMLAAVENEAQIATILAHEGAHFTHRHAYQQTAYMKSAAAVAAAVSLTGIPIIGDLVAISSIFGYSREHEREADRVGFQRLVAAGYDPAQAVAPFGQLLTMAEATDSSAPFFWATHPALEERIADFEGFAAARPGGGERGDEVYRQRTAGVLVAAVEEALDRGRYDDVIVAFEELSIGQRAPLHGHYYLGEAYRRRNLKGDEERSLVALRRALEHAPTYAPTYRALGRQHLRRGDAAAARECLERYLALAPHADDRAYVRQTLAGLP